MEDFRLPVELTSSELDEVAGGSGGSLVNLNITILVNAANGVANGDANGDGNVLFGASGAFGNFNGNGAGNGSFQL